ncbi:hypothetical protein Tco_0469007 [Tanacetum coccineum]
MVFRDASSTRYYTSVSYGSSEHSAWGIPLALRISDETEPFEEDETAAYLHHHPRRGATDQTVSSSGPLGIRAAMIRMKDDILRRNIATSRRFVLTAPSPSCDIAESSVAAAARASRDQYDFVDAVGTRQGLVRSPGHEAQTIARVVDKAKEVGYARALQDSEHRMMTSIEEVNLRVSYQVQARKRESEDFYTQLLDAQTDRRDIRLKIDVVRGQRTAYETELQEVRQAYLRSEVQNRALLARLETLEIHMTRMDLSVDSSDNIHGMSALARPKTLDFAIALATICWYQKLRLMRNGNFNRGQKEANQNAGTEEIIDSGDSDKEDESAQDCFVLPIWPSYSSPITPALTTDDKREGPREGKEQVLFGELKL